MMSDQLATFKEWFARFRECSNFHDVEASLQEVEPYGEKQAYPYLKNLVYESCYRALAWKEGSEKTIRTEKGWHELSKGLNTLAQQTKQARELLENSPDAAVFLSNILREKLKKKKITILDRRNRIWGAQFENTLIPFLESFEDVLIESADLDNPFNLKKAINHGHPGRQEMLDSYMCFAFPERENILHTKHIDITTALTIQISSLFRLYSDSSLLQISGSMGELGELKRIGKPCVIQAAEIALYVIVGMRKHDGSDEISKLKYRVKSFVKKNSDVSLYLEWR